MAIRNRQIFITRFSVTSNLFGSRKLVQRRRNGWFATFNCTPRQKVTWVLVRDHVLPIWSRKWVFWCCPRVMASKRVTCRYCLEIKPANQLFHRCWTTYEHAINGSNQNDQYVHTDDSAFSVFCFVLLFLPPKLFATSPFSTFWRNDTVASRTVPEVVHNPSFPHEH